MPNIVYNKKSIFFVHIPKTSGTSLYANLLAQGAVVEDYNPYKPAFEGVTSQHLDARQINLFFCNPQNKFTVIRDPWQRTLSSYVYRTKDSSFNKLDSWLKINLIKYKTNNNVLDNHLKPMSSFIDKQTRIFSIDKLDSMHEWINTVFDRSFSYNLKKNVSCEYKHFKFTKLSNEVQSMWQELYTNDILLYNRLTNNKINSNI